MSAGMKDAKDILKAKGPAVLRSLVEAAVPSVEDPEGTIPGDSSAVSNQIAPPRPASPVDGPRSPEELLALMDSREFSAGHVVPPPEPVFSIADRIISTPGNITNVQGIAKSGKSAVLGAMLAAVFNGDRQGADTLGFLASNHHGRALIHIDTEQSRYDHDQLVRKSLVRARADVPPGWFHSFWTTDLAVSDRRCALRHLIRRAADQCGGVFAVIIDGVADLISSVNDEESSRAFVAELHRFAIDFNCAVVTVLHENPGSTNGKTRGHLGSELERKAETNLQICKDANGISTIWADRARHCNFPKSDGHCFAWSITEGMHVSKGRAGEIKANANRAKWIEEAESAFDEDVELRRCDLISRVMPIAGIKEEAGKKRIASYCLEGIIEKNRDGNYRLSAKRRGKGV
jgi:hypothetical protein